MKSILKFGTLSLLSLCSFAAYGEDLPVVNVAIDVTYQPFEFYDDAGNPAGFDIEIIDAIAKNQGFEAKYQVYITYETLFEKLKGGEVDFAPAMVPSEIEEEDYLQTTTPYLISYNCVAGLDDSMIADWAKANIAITENEDQGDFLVETYGVNADTMKSYVSQFLALAGIVRKQSDMLVSDCVTLKHQVKSESFTKFYFFIKELPRDADEDTLVGFILNKENMELLSKLNKGLENIRASGEYEDIMDKWHVGEKYRIK